MKPVQPSAVQAALRPFSLARQRLLGPVRAWFARRPTLLFLVIWLAFNASLNSRFTIGELLIEPLKIHGIGNSKQERLQLAAAMLKRVGLPEQAMQRYPHEFSGGQRQRIAIARCLMLRPEVLILDEAVSALDVSVQAQVLNLLQDLQDEFGLSYIFISHDLSVVKYISDVVLVMQNGQVVETADSDQLYASPQTDYTRNLLNAIPGR